jgi:TonB family protein
MLRTVMGNSHPDPTREVDTMRRVIVVALSLLFIAAPAWSQNHQDEQLPAFGTYVAVDTPPEAFMHVAPVYPELARRAGVSGLVLVQALVDRRGDVADARVIKSIPMLDQAAIDCVRKWHFKPAIYHGAPVAVWVAVPVKFDLSARDEHRHDSPPPPVPVAATDLAEGRYAINGSPNDVVIVTRVGGDRVLVENPGQWEGAGVMHGMFYWGAFVYRDDAREFKNRGAHGTHAGTLDASGRLHVKGTFSNRPWPAFESTWVPVDERADKHGDDDHHRDDWRATDPGHVEVPAPGSADHPEWPAEWFKGDPHILLAEQVDVDGMPEVVHRVEPGLDTEHMNHGADIEALVVVRARVEVDGTVSDARIARSVPYFNDAALEAVRQWRFRPASRHGHPVSVSVYVPLRFVVR